jgi:peroxiredoxin
MTAGHARVPDFELPDQNGQVIRLSDRFERSPVLLAFFRGHWCPYCRRYLCKLQANRDRFEERSVRLLAISPEPPGTSNRLARELNLSFPILSDSTGTVIDAYGTRNGFTQGRALLPHPSVFLIDTAGFMRFRSIDRNYKRRTTMRAVFQQIDSLLGAPTG